MFKARGIVKVVGAGVLAGCMLAISAASFGEKKDEESQSGMSGMSGMEGMSGMGGMQGMQGMPGMGGMQGMPGMGGMQGMPGMGGMQGMPGMGGMQGMPGMGGMQGMPGMGGMYGMYGMPGMSGMQGMMAGMAAQVIVDSTDKARQQATNWLTATRQENVIVGPITKVDLVYVVNIVDKASPHELRNQMIIRGADGFFITVR